MTDNADLREELGLMIQLLVVEGAKIVGAFADLHGLHHTDVEALIRVHFAQERGTPLTPGSLATELGLTSGAITFVVDRLERAGHINRVRHDTDRRKVLLHYSPRGRALANEFFEPRERERDAGTDQFTRAELETVRRFLAVTIAGTTAAHQALTAQAVNRAPHGQSDRK